LLHQLTLHLSSLERIDRTIEKISASFKAGDAKQAKVMLRHAWQCDLPLSTYDAALPLWLC